jgi:hypothetical protein
MKRSVRRAAALRVMALASVAASLPAATVLAQPASCTVDQSKPKELAIATLALAQAQGNTNPAARTKSLRDAV